MNGNVEPTGEPIVLSLTRAEALVLYEWLASRDDTRNLVPEPASEPTCPVESKTL